MGYRGWMTALAMLAATPAAAQNVTAADPQAIASVLRDAGYKAELTKDGNGDPLIRSASSGRDFLVLFYNCEAGKNCSTLQFYAGFKHKGVTLEKLNAWNTRMRFGRAYLDNEKDPRIEMDVNLDKGGVARGNLSDNVAVWINLVDSFAKDIGFE